MTILAATKWNTNADLIVACHELGYLREDDVVLDPTYGGGGWWTRWRPTKLVARDRKLDGSDFRDIRDHDATYDAITFDPPYVSPGGRATSGIPEMHDRYGMNETEKSPRLLFEDNTHGFAECVRVLKPKGTILYKSMDYVSSGKMHPVTNWIIDDALDRGLVYFDRLEHIGDPRPQPKKNPDGSVRRQVHAQRNLSTLLVFRKPRK